MKDCPDSRGLTKAQRLRAFQELVWSAWRDLKEHECEVRAAREAQLAQELVINERFG